MKHLVISLTASVLLAGPALAQDQGAADANEQPQMCEMMHNGEKMKGMMVRGEDGTMSCRMMDHTNMEHGHMNHEHMEHGHSGHSNAEESQDDATPQGESGAEDHSAHAGHAPG